MKSFVMGYNRLILLVVFFVVFFSIQVIGAVDVNNDTLLVSDSSYGDGSFSEIQSKIDSDRNGSIFLNKNYSSSSGQVVISKDITIDGKGHVLDAMSKSDCIFNVRSNVNLVNIVFTNYKDYAVSVSGNGFVNVINCSFIGGGSVAIMNDVNNPLVVRNSTFIDNFGRGYGGAIYSSGDVIVSDSTFVGNVARVSGGAIYSKAHVVVSNSRFDSNSASPNGGAIFADKVQVSNSVFSRNSAKSKGGAIYSSECVFGLNNNFTLNSAESCGGAVYADFVRSGIENATFDSNFASGDGGALYVMLSSVFTVGSSCFVNNYADMGDGGAIYSNSDSSTITLSQCVFEGNYANNGKLRRMGGAVYSEGSLKVGNSTFLKNWAENQGGAVYCKGTITFEGRPSYFIDNVAKKSSGGAVFTSRMDGCCNVVFMGNKANGGDGGALYVNNAGTMTLSNCYFASNFASGKGGAIYTDSRKSKLVLKNNVFYTNNAGEGKTVYNSGCYNVVSGNLWGGNNPGAKNDQLVEWKPWPLSNVYHVDSRPASIGVSADNSCYVDGSVLIKIAYSWNLNDCPIYSDNIALSSNLNGDFVYKAVVGSDVLVYYIPREKGNHIINVDVCGQKFSHVVDVVCVGVFASDLVKFYGDATPFSARFRDIDGDYLVEGSVVSFEVDGVVYNATVGKLGVAHLYVNLMPGNYSVKSINPVTGDFCFNNISILSKVSEYYVNDTYYASFFDSDGNVLSDGNIIDFVVGNQSFSSVVVDGVASFNLDFVPGVYRVNVVYDGDIVFSDTINISDRNFYFGGDFSFGSLKPIGNENFFTVDDFNYYSSLGNNYYRVINVLENTNYIVYNITVSDEDSLVSLFKNISSNRVEADILHINLLNRTYSMSSYAFKDSDYYYLVNVNYGQVYINGNGAVIEDKDHYDYVFACVSRNAKLYLSNLTLKKFNQCFKNYGSIYVNDSIFVENDGYRFSSVMAHSTSRGSVINNFNQAFFVNCYFVDNTNHISYDWNGGGVLYAQRNSVTAFVNCSFKSETDNIRALPGSSVVFYQDSDDVSVIKKGSSSFEVGSYLCVKPLTFWYNPYYENVGVFNCSNGDELFDALLVANSYNNFSSIVINLNGGNYVFSEEQFKSIRNNNYRTSSYAYGEDNSITYPCTFCLEVGCVPVTINGHNSVISGLNGQSLAENSDTENFVRFAFVSKFGSLVINDLYFKEYVGVIDNFGTLHLNNVGFRDNSNNRNLRSFAGGVLYNVGKAYCVNCTFINNKGVTGGAIYNDGYLSCVNSTFKDNTVDKYGGAIYCGNSPGTFVQVIGGEFSNNVEKSTVASLVTKGLVYVPASLVGLTGLVSFVPQGFVDSVSRFVGSSNDIYGTGTAIIKVSGVDPVVKNDDDSKVTYGGSEDIVVADFNVTCASDLVAVRNLVNSNYGTYDIIRIHFSPFDYVCSHDDGSFFDVKYGSVIIDGAGASISVYSSSKSDEIKFLSVGNSACVVLNNLAISGFNIAIFNEGGLEVHNCNFTGNMVDYNRKDDYGGAIHNKGYLLVNSSVFSGNYAKYGGAIYNNGYAICFNSTFVNNTGYNNDNKNVDVYNFDGVFNYFGCSSINLVNDFHMSALTRDIVESAKLIAIVASSFLVGYGVATAVSSVFAATTATAVGTVAGTVAGTAIGTVTALVMATYDHDFSNVLSSVLQSAALSFSFASMGAKLAIPQLNPGAGANGANDGGAGAVDGGAGAVDGGAGVDGKKGVLEHPIKQVSRADIVGRNEPIERLGIDQKYYQRMVNEMQDPLTRIFVRLLDVMLRAGQAIDGAVDSIVSGAGKAINAVGNVLDGVSNRVVQVMNTIQNYAMSGVSSSFRWDVLYYTMFNVYAAYCSAHPEVLSQIGGDVNPNSINVNPNSVNVNNNIIINDNPIDNNIFSSNVREYSIINSILHYNNFNLVQRLYVIGILYPNIYNSVLSHVIENSNVIITDNNLGPALENYVNEYCARSEEVAIENIEAVIRQSLNINGPNVVGSVNFMDLLYSTIVNFLDNQNSIENQNEIRVYSIYNLFPRVQDCLNNRALMDDVLGQIRTQLHINNVNNVNDKVKDNNVNDKVKDNNVNDKVNDNAVSNKVDIESLSDFSRSLLNRYESFVREYQAFRSVISRGHESFVNDPRYAFYANNLDQILVRRNAFVVNSITNGVDMTVQLDYIRHLLDRAKNLFKTIQQEKAGNINKNPCIIVKEKQNLIVEEKQNLIFKENPSLTVKRQPSLILKEKVNVQQKIVNKKYSKFNVDVAKNANAKDILNALNKNRDTALRYIGEIDCDYPDLANNLRRNLKLSYDQCSDNIINSTNPVLIYTQFISKLNRMFSNLKVDVVNSNDYSVIGFNGILPKLDLNYGLYDCVFDSPDLFASYTNANTMRSQINSGLSYIKSVNSSLYNTIVNKLASNQSTRHINISNLASLDVNGLINLYNSIFDILGDYRNNTHIIATQKDIVIQKIKFGNKFDEVIFNYLSKDEQKRIFNHMLNQVDVSLHRYLSEDMDYAGEYSDGIAFINQLKFDMLDNDTVDYNRFLEVHKLYILRMFQDFNLDTLRVDYRILSDEDLGDLILKSYALFCSFSGHDYRNLAYYFTSFKDFTFGDQYKIDFMCLSCKIANIVNQHTLDSRVQLIAIYNNEVLPLISFFKVWDEIGSTHNDTHKVNFEMLSKYPDTYYYSVDSLYAKVGGLLSQKFIYEYEDFDGYNYILSLFDFSGSYRYLDTLDNLNFIVNIYNCLRNVDGLYSQKNDTVTYIKNQINLFKQTMDKDPVMKKYFSIASEIGPSYVSNDLFLSAIKVLEDKYPDVMAFVSMFLDLKDTNNLQSVITHILLLCKYYLNIDNIDDNSIYLPYKSEIIRSYEIISPKSILDFNNANDFKAAAMNAKDKALKYIDVIMKVDSVLGNDLTIKVTNLYNNFINLLAVNDPNKNLESYKTFSNNLNSAFSNLRINLLNYYVRSSLDDFPVLNLNDGLYGGIFNLPILVNNMPNNILLPLIIQDLNYLKSINTLLYNDIEKNVGYTLNYMNINAHNDASKVYKSIFDILGEYRNNDKIVESQENRIIQLLIFSTPSDDAAKVYYNLLSKNNQKYVLDYMLNKSAMSLNRYNASKINIFSEINRNLYVNMFKELHLNVENNISSSRFMKVYELYRCVMFKDNVASWDFDKLSDEDLGNLIIKNYIIYTLAINRDSKAAELWTPSFYNSYTNSLLSLPIISCVVSNIVKQHSSYSRENLENILMEIKIAYLYANINNYLMYSNGTFDFEYLSQYPQLYKSIIAKLQFRIDSLLQGNSRLEVRQFTNKYASFDTIDNVKCLVNIYNAIHDKDNDNVDYLTVIRNEIKNFEQKINNTNSQKYLNITSMLKMGSTKDIIQNFKNKYPEIMRFINNDLSKYGVTIDDLDNYFARYYLRIYSMIYLDLTSVPIYIVHKINFDIVYGREQTYTFEKMSLVGNEWKPSELLTAGTEAYNKALNLSKYGIVRYGPVFESKISSLKEAYRIFKTAYDDYKFNNPNMSDLLFKFNRIGFGACYLKFIDELNEIFANVRFGDEIPSFENDNILDNTNIISSTIKKETFDDKVTDKYIRSAGNRAYLVAQEHLYNMNMDKVMIKNIKKAFDVFTDSMDKIDVKGEKGSDKYKEGINKCIDVYNTYVDTLNQIFNKILIQNNDELKDSEITKYHVKRMDVGSLSLNDISDHVKTIVDEAKLYIGEKAKSNFELYVIYNYRLYNEIYKDFNSNSKLSSHAELGRLYNNFVDSVEALVNEFIIKINNQYSNHQSEISKHALSLQWIYYPEDIHQPLNALNSYLYNLAESYIKNISIFDSNIAKKLSEEFYSSASSFSNPFDLIELINSVFYLDGEKNSITINQVTRDIYLDIKNNILLNENINIKDINPNADQIFNCTFSILAGRFIVLELRYPEIAKDIWNNLFKTDFIDFVLNHGVENTYQVIIDYIKHPSNYNSGGSSITTPSDAKDSFTNMTTKELYDELALYMSQFPKKNKYSDGLKERYKQLSDKYAMLSKNPGFDFDKEFDRNEIIELYCLAKDFNSNLNTMQINNLFNKKYTFFNEDISEINDLDELKSLISTELKNISNISPNLYNGIKTWFNMDSIKNLDECKKQYEELYSYCWDFMDVFSYTTYLDNLQKKYLNTPQFKSLSDKINNYFSKSSYYLGFNRNLDGANYTTIKQYIIDEMSRIYKYDKHLHEYYILSFFNGLNIADFFVSFESENSIQSALDYKSQNFYKMIQRMIQGQKDIQDKISKKTFMADKKRIVVDNFIDNTKIYKFKSEHRQLLYMIINIADYGLSSELSNALINAYLTPSLSNDTAISNIENRIKSYFELPKGFKRLGLLTDILNLNIDPVVKVLLLTELNQLCKSFNQTSYNQLGFEVLKFKLFSNSPTIIFKDELKLIDSLINLTASASGDFKTTAYRDLKTILMNKMNNPKSNILSIDKVKNIMVYWGLSINP